MSLLWKRCPFCKRYILESHLINHVRVAHIKTTQDSKKFSFEDKILTTDDSGRIISLEEYAEIHGEVVNDRDRERRLLNIKPTKKDAQKNIFQEISQIEEKPQPRFNLPLKIECRYCHKFIEKNKIREHNILKHLDELPIKHRQEKKHPLPKLKKKKGGEPDIAPEGEQGNMAEAFKQAFNETRYGAKGMHHRHEWDGKFGSTPLHDDYDDESDSE
jgi:hypothetical protein